MFNAKEYDNSKPDGFAVLEIVDSHDREGSWRSFVPLKRSHLKGSIAGPLCDMHLSQTFGYTKDQCSKTLEAAYRFPMPGDAAVTGVSIHFGEVVIEAELKERQAAEAEYEEAKSQGRQAALTTRESPDVFTIRIAGLQPDQDILVETSYVQLARSEGPRWSLRVPLTTAPRYTRSDEHGTRHADGQPLAIMRDPGHRFSMALTVEGSSSADCKTHAIKDDQDGGNLIVRLRDDEVIPDRDLVINWDTKRHPVDPKLHVLTHRDGENVYFLSMAAPPAIPQRTRVSREMVLLIDRSGSMEGSKWQAADDAANGLLNDLGTNDTFALGLFHNTTRWLTPKPVSATDSNLNSARSFLQRRDSGGTELGVALEQAITLPRCTEARARTVVVITDAQVSDEGRILRLVHEEAKRLNPRRVSMICIDSAPNAHLVNEIVDAGCGIARFLSSAPEQEQLSSALVGLTEEFASPLAAGVTLEVNRTGLEVFGRRVDISSENSSRVVMGDLPAGRTAWISGRYKVSAETDAVFRLRTAEGSEIAACNAAPGRANHKALKPLFGAKRLNALEYLMTAGHSGTVLRDRMREIGFGDAAVDSKGVQPSLYAENSMDACRKALRELLVKESLEYGIACSETAFVAVRKEDGKQVEESVAVANALPTGWSDACLYQMSAPSGPSFGGKASMMMARCAPYPIQASTQSVIHDSMVQYDLCCDSDMVNDSGVATPFFRRLLNRLTGKPNHITYTEAPLQRVEVYCGLPITENGELVLFDSLRDCDANTLTYVHTVFRTFEVTVSSTPVTAADPAMCFEIYIGEGESFAVQMTLAELLAHNGAMPLSICRHSGERIRIVLLDPNGRWENEAPMIEIRMGW